MKNSLTQAKQQSSNLSKKTKKQIDKKQNLINDLNKQNNLLKQEIVKLQESQKRVLADYQNLLRRNREDRIALIRMANKDIIEGLLEPLDFLKKATKQIDDQGLEMAINQLNTTLKDYGLEEIDVLGKEFDSKTMEVVEKIGEGEKVVEVVLGGYRLNNNVIRFAKVIVE